MNTLEETTMASMVLTLTFYGLFKFGVINWYPTLLFFVVFCVGLFMLQNKRRTKNVEVLG